MASPPSRSYFQKTVSLHDWWLTKPQTDDGIKTLGVSGLTCNSQLSRAERCFCSAPIMKIYDFFELETVDGICVILQGYINKDKTLENGFSSEVFEHFVKGFPPYWEEFSASCHKRGSMDESVSRENVDEKDPIEQDDGEALHCDNHTLLLGDEDCEDKISCVNDVSSVETPHEHIMKDLSEDDPRVVVRTPSMRKRNKCDDEKDKRTVLKKEKESPKERSNNKKKRVESKRKLTFPHLTTPESTPKNKGGQSADILSPECFSSGKRSRSGRLLLPTLEFWRNQTVVYDGGWDPQVTGIRDVSTGSTKKDAR